MQNQPPRRDTPSRFSPEERELFLRELRRIEGRVDEIGRAVLEQRSLPQDVRELTSDFRDLAREFRDTLSADAAQERFIGQLNAQVQALAAQEGQRAGRDAGGKAGGLLGSVEGREAARDETKNSNAKATVIAIVISAFTAGVVQGLVEALKPKPAHVQPPAHLIQP